MTPHLFAGRRDNAGMGGMRKLGHLSLTDQAIAAMRTCLPRPDEALIRIMAMGGGPSAFEHTLSVTKAALTTDKVFHVDGFRVCIDEDSDRWFTDTVVDFHDGAFVFRHQQAPA